MHHMLLTVFRSPLLYKGLIERQQTKYKVRFLQVARQQYRTRDKCWAVYRPTLATNGFSSQCIFLWLHPVARSQSSYLCTQPQTRDSREIAHSNRQKQWKILRKSVESLRHCRHHTKHLACNEECNTLTPSPQYQVMPMLVAICRTVTRHQNEQHFYTS